MEDPEPDLDTVEEYLEAALDADPDEKDYYIRHALQAIATITD